MSEAHEALRVRIEAALRERWPDARVSVRPPMEDRYGGHDAMVVATWGNVEVLASGEDEQTALGEVAEAVCLDVRERADYLEARRGALLDEIERLQRERDEARESALDRADDFDRLVIRVWRAATGDTHEGPASVEALVAAVVRLTNTIESVTGQICDMTTRHDSLRAIIEGRTVAPTDAEIVAHWRAGGMWIVEGVIVLRDIEAVRAHRDQASWAAVTWLPINRSRRPCAWPVVEVTP